MAAPAVGFSDRRAARFFETTVGMKIVMAITGAVLFLFVVGHLLGNLQVFEGREALNRYAVFLRIEPPLLWTVRIVLLICVLLHIWSSWKLWRRKREARPVKYEMKKPAGSSYASRTMYWSGPIILAFVIYHLMQYTFGVGGTPYDQWAGHPGEIDVYANLVHGFRIWPISAFYIIAMVLLCLHLYHGIWSAFQTLGASHPRYTPMLKNAAALIAILLAAGYISIPVAILTGLIGGDVQ
ncbi:MAG TPA: succinate dehydrogenase cytochrome b subunit [Bryobacteraceae bacterium]|nr:succinate dehydrogenase cytochrome b subunit [Bryobacteraceae bacterium]